MNQYFFKMTNEERTSILDQHKHIYDGYVTNYAKQNEQPLYTQDFANDKNGVTLNNKGVVSNYKNVGINESILESEEDESYMVSVGEQLDMIGDGEDDLEHGTFSHEDEEDEETDENEFKDLSMYNPYYGDDETAEFNDIDLSGLLDLEDEEMNHNLQEQVNKSLDMFRRFKNI